MAVIEGGLSAALQDVGEDTLAARVQVRPTDVGIFGSYAIASRSGTMAAGLAGGSTVYSCRWGDTSRAMLLRRVGIQAKNLTTAFAAGVTTFDLVIARSFSGADSGGTSILPTGNNQKRRTSFGTTLLSDLRISSTAALTVGTRTPDAAPINLTVGFVPATSINYPFISRAGSINIPGASNVAYSMDWFDLFAIDVSSEWPIVFVQNEGFIIRATVPGTGTWEFAILMEWSEVAITAGYN